MKLKKAKDFFYRKFMFHQLDFSLPFLIDIFFFLSYSLFKVVSRWWSMFTVLPYPDRIALKLISYCPGKVFFRKVIS